MSTKNQLIKGARINASKKSKSPALSNCPQRKAVCTKVYVTSPKKTKLCKT